MTRATDEFPLEGSLALLRVIWRLDHALATASHKMVRALGITAPQRMALRLIGKFPGLSQSELTHLLHLDKGTTSVTLRRLEAKGLVERTSHDDDRRRAHLSVTKRGKELLAKRDVTLEALLDRLLDEHDPVIVRAAEALLTSLAESLEGAAPPPSRTRESP